MLKDKQLIEIKILKELEQDYIEIQNISNKKIKKLKIIETFPIENFQLIKNDFQSILKLKNKEVFNYPLNSLINNIEILEKEFIKFSNNQDQIVKIYCDFFTTGFNFFLSEIEKNINLIITHLKLNEKTNYFISNGNNVKMINDSKNKEDLVFLSKLIRYDYKNFELFYDIFYKKSLQSKLKIENNKSIRKHLNINTFKSIFLFMTNQNILDTNIEEYKNFLFHIKILKKNLIVKRKHLILIEQALLFPNEKIKVALEPELLHIPNHKYWFENNNKQLFNIKNSNVKETIVMNIHYYKNEIKFSPLFFSNREYQVKLEKVINR